MAVDDGTGVTVYLADLGYRGEDATVPAESRLDADVAIVDRTVVPEETYRGLRDLPLPDAAIETYHGEMPVAERNEADPVTGMVDYLQAGNRIAVSVVTPSTFPATFDFPVFRYATPDSGDPVLGEWYDAVAETDQDFWSRVREQAAEREFVLLGSFDQPAEEALETAAADAVNQYRRHFIGNIL